MLEEDAMDDLENPNADEPIAGAVDADAPQDPVQAARDEAWLAQFRADNAAAVMQYDFRATIATEAEEKAQEARRDDDLMRAGTLDKDAVQARTEAADYEKKAEHEAARHDEYEAKAQTSSHIAHAAEAMATDLRADAKEADAAVKRLDAEKYEEFAIYEKDSNEYRIMQEQAVAAQRIATDEAKLPHPGDAPAGGAQPGGQAPTP